MRTTWYSVYARYPDGRRTELMMFETEKTATVHAKKCAAHDDGKMAFEVCKVEVCVVPAFTKESTRCPETRKREKELTP